MPVGIFVFDDGQKRPSTSSGITAVPEKEKVYVRRGSSTTPSKPATLDEIALMGAGKPRDRAELLVEFARIDRDDAVGARVQMTCEFCDVPEMKDIPKLPSPYQGPYGIRYRLHAPAQRELLS